MSRVPGGCRGYPQAGRWAADPRLAAGPPMPQQSPEAWGDLVGVVWGEGGGPVNQRGRAAGADISAWIVRLIRAVWRRYFVHGGKA